MFVPAHFCHRLHIVSTHLSFYCTFLISGVFYLFSLFEMIQCFRILISSSFTIKEKKEHIFYYYYPTSTFVLSSKQISSTKGPLAPLIIPSLISSFHLIRTFLHSPSPFLTCPKTPSTPPPLPLCKVQCF